MKILLSFIFFFLFILLVQSTDVSYIFSTGYGYGDYSPKLTAQPQIGNIHTDYYVCGVDLLESRWVVSLWNCNCGNCWYRWRRGWRCNWCDNEFWSQVSAARVKYCHKDNWENQRTQIFSTGKTATRGWRQLSCPPQQYVSGIAISVGNTHGVELGMVGVRLRCQNKDFTQRLFVQNTYGYAPGEMSVNPAKTFLTGLQFRHLKNDKFTGLRAYFGMDLKPQSVAIEYGKIELIGEKVLKTIESFEKQNREIQAIQYNITFSKNYSTSGSWTNDIDVLNGIQLSETTVVPRPVIEGTKIVQNAYYKVTNRSPFQFKLCQSVTYTSANTVPTLIAYCSVQKALAVVEEQKVKAPYTMTLRYVIPSTNEVVYRKVTGIYEGFAEISIKTDTSIAIIPGCQSD